MPGVSKRSKAGKYRYWFTDEHGKRKFGTGFTDKARTLKLAEELELQSRREREGLVDTGHRLRQAAATKPLSDHIEAYRQELLAKGGTARHAKHIAGAVRRLLDSASIHSVADLSPERVQSALGRMTAAGKSPRTRNHALNALKAFARWLEDNNRIKDVPRGLLKIEIANEKIDRRRERRAASMEEIERLFAAAESGPDRHIYGRTRSKHSKIVISGPHRATLYRLALGTGFRANELRSLRPEWFRLEGDEPGIFIPPEHTKNKKGAVQPITKELAAGLKAFVAQGEPGKPLLTVPDRTAAMLRADLEAAGIPYEVKGRVLDFHALRGSYITALVKRGVNVKIVQKLARHSTITLTLDLYTHLDDGDLRRAIEGDSGTNTSADTPAHP